MILLKVYQLLKERKYEGAFSTLTPDYVHYYDYYFHISTSTLVLGTVGETVMSRCRMF